MEKENQISTQSAPKEIASDDMAQQLFKTIADALEGGKLDADAFEKVVNVQMSIIDRQRKEEFNRDLNAACFEMPTITKRGAIKNKQGRIQSRYSKWPDLQGIIYPILQKHNLRISHDIDSDNGKVIVQLIMSHANGYSERGGRSVWPLDTGGSKSGTQGAGSSATYGQRHTTIKYLGIVEMDATDDDGRGGQKQPQSLTVNEKTILADAEQAALGGLAAYSAWYSQQSNTIRGWLVDGEHHAKFKVMADS